MKKIILQNPTPRADKFYVKDTKTKTSSHAINTRHAAEKIAERLNKSAGATDRFYVIGIEYSDSKQNPKSLTLLDKERKHVTAKEKQAILALLNAKVDAGKIGRKNYIITERAGDQITVEIWEQYRREATGKMEWTKNTVQLIVK